jgi:hypothetical protein
MNNRKEKYKKTIKFDNCYNCMQTLNIFHYLHCEYCLEEDKKYICIKCYINEDVIEKINNKIKCIGCNNITTKDNLYCKKHNNFIVTDNSLFSICEKCFFPNINTNKDDSDSINLPL